MPNGAFRRPPDIWARRAGTTRASGSGWDGGRAGRRRQPGARNRRDRSVAVATVNRWGTPPAMRLALRFVIREPPGVAVAGRAAVRPSLDARATVHGTRRTGGRAPDIVGRRRQDGPRPDARPGRRRPGADACNDPARKIGGKVPSSYALRPVVHRAPAPCRAVRPVGGGNAPGSPVVQRAASALGHGPLDARGLDGSVGEGVTIRTACDRMARCLPVSPLRPSPWRPRHRCRASSPSPRRLAVNRRSGRRP